MKRNLVLFTTNNTDVIDLIKKEDMIRQCYAVSTKTDSEVKERLDKSPVICFKCYTKEITIDEAIKLKKMISAKEEQDLSYYDKFWLGVAF